MNYHFTQKPIDKAAQYTAEQIKRQLENGKKVLFLLSGGSGIDIALKTFKKLSPANTVNLTVTLTDERFGAVGHENENWQQLIDNGLDIGQAKFYRPLQGRTISKTASNFDDWISNEVNNSDFIIGIFGVGIDGHTAGIKPHSIAVDSKKYVDYYVASDFERVTITPKIISRMNLAVIQISGDEKKIILDKLINENIDIHIQPAQILKTIPESILFSNIEIKEEK